ncbi:hypothetical protein C1H46_017734 [Malus baccata]|uniref:Uncharacterized protein n=1 Tax=Malus baccata TaxID=106549 RepID=A0A540ME06_MALBA|nr:hypothetical protein C1H46_017734 [Malus baccata]
MQFVGVNNGSHKVCISEIPKSSLINSTATHSKACILEIPHLIIHGRPADFGSQVRFFAAPVQFQTNTKKEEQSMSGLRLNEKITAEFVRLVLDEVESNDFPRILDTRSSLSVTDSFLLLPLESRALHLFPPPNTLLIH